MEPHNSTIPAVETRYNSILFRSRLEARWAVFYDVLGIKYLYEPEKYQVGTERYIPDYFLPEINEDGEDAGLFVEVKGIAPDNMAMRKGIELCKLTKKVVVIISGQIGEHNGMCVPIFPDGPTPIDFQQCILCGLIFMGSQYHDCPPETELAEFFNIDDGFSDYVKNGDHNAKFDLRSPMLALAYECARSARFESPSFPETVQSFSEKIRLLQEHRIFGSEERVRNFYKHAHELSIDPRCPRFVRYPIVSGGPRNA